MEEPTAGQPQVPNPYAQPHPGQPYPDLYSAGQQIPAQQIPAQQVPGQFYPGQPTAAMAPNAFHPELKLPKRANPVGAVILAVIIGVVVAFLGTVMYPSVFYLGTSGLWLPWGIVLSFVLSVACLIFVGLTTRSAKYSTITAVVAFVVVALMALGIPSGGMIATNVAAGVPSAYLGFVWPLLLIIAIVVAQTLIVRVLRKEKARLEAIPPA